MNYSFLFIVLWAFFIAYWIVHIRGNKKSLSSGRPLVKMLTAALKILFLALLIAMWTVPGWPTMQLIPVTDATVVVGLLLCAVGMAFAIWARRTLGTNWSRDPSIQEGHELITRGPYRVTRHPIYTGVLLAVFGSNLAYGAVRNAVLFVVVTVGVVLQLKIEERLMMRRFPDAYPQYKKKVRALIPFVF